MQIVSHSQWRSTFGQDAHQRNFHHCGQIDFVGELSGQQIHVLYKLVTGSSGINEGTPISLVPDDYEGTSRPQGGGWDVSAFEMLIMVQANNINVRLKYFYRDHLAQIPC